MSEQANALADMLMNEFRISEAMPDIAWGELQDQIAEKIDTMFAPPCPECGASAKPSIKWACGSWQDGPARQISVKCVRRQMAVLKKERDELAASLAAYDGTDAAEEMKRIGSPGFQPKPRGITEGPLRKGGRNPGPAVPRPDGEMQAQPPPKPVEPEGQIVKEGEPPDAMT